MAGGIAEAIFCRTTTSAKAAVVQCVMGTWCSLSLGGSHAIFTRWATCWAVKRLGFPGQGASSKTLRM